MSGHLLRTGLVLDIPDPQATVVSDCRQVDPAAVYSHRGDRLDVGRHVVHQGPYKSKKEFNIDQFDVVNKIIRI